MYSSDTIERLAAWGNPYSVTKAELMNAVRPISREVLAKRFEHDAFLANFALNHWEYAHGVHTLTTYPWNVAIPISDVCNARCTFCNSWLRGKRLLKLDDLERFGPVLKTAVMVSLEGHGEPLVHPQFRDIVKTLRRLVDKRCRFSIITNGLLLDEHLDDILALGVNVFNVSLNAASPSVHEEVMGLGKDAFVKVIATLRELIRRGREMGASDISYRPAVNVSLVVTAMNIHEIPAFIQLAESMGANQVNLRTLLPQTALLAGLNYHVLPAYLAEDFEKHVAAARAAIAAARVTVDADVASWSKPVFPEAVQKRIDLDSPRMIDRQQAVRVIKLHKEEFRDLEQMTSKGALLALGEKSESRWTNNDEKEAVVSLDGSERSAWYQCADVYTTFHMNDFFFVLRPCCYIDTIPNHEVIKYDGSYDFFEAWNSAAMVSLRKRLHEGPLYSMCTRCPKQVQYHAPEPHIGGYEPVLGGQGLWEARTAWDAEVIDRGDEGVLVVTPEPQWAYAAAMSLQLPAARVGGRVVVDLQVEEGAVGVSLLDSRKEKFLSEIGRDTRSPTGLISFSIDDFSKATGLIVRNTSAGGKRSRVQVRSVQVQQRRGLGACEDDFVANRDMLALTAVEPTKNVASASWIEKDGEHVLRVEGNPVTWAYLAIARLKNMGSNGTGPAAVKVRLRVEKGQVSVGLLNMAETDFITQVYWGNTAEQLELVLRCDAIEDVAALVIRTTDMVKPPPVLTVFGMEVALPECALLQ